ncbi:metal ABC transporter ATP-binding protein [Georgenia sp. SYP-B2076]|uniref:metal ABC transporter ATP-binding protein n=1 Tax=Georgenia sp. SYP-B2076 TaxID=2495881 RepID=UPI000F8DEECD|nr:metal ABC transporter ATP-binding protein [Georgenia sp. SYP-B2076]
MDAPPIVTEDLTVVLGTSTILRGISLTVGRGEIVALLGANGSGKSTLVKSLVGIVPITRGHARLFGRDVGGHRRDVPWARMGYVPQRVTASGGVPATALEVVTSGLVDNGRLRLPRDARKRSLEALAQVGLADRADDSVQVFSGGQHQRVLIARALVREPELLILDEPLAGIDKRSKEALAATLADLHGRGTTILVVLHELGELGALLERAILLRHGRVVHDGARLPAAVGHDDALHDHVHAHDDDAGRLDAHVPNLRVDL